MKGKKKSRKTKDQLRKQVADLQKCIDEERRAKEKYKKRLQHLEKKTSSKSTAVPSDVRRSALHHTALVAQIKEHYKNAKTEREKQIIRKICIGSFMQRTQKKFHTPCSAASGLSGWFTLPLLIGTLVCVSFTKT